MRVAPESGALAEFEHTYGDVVTACTITDSSGGIVSRVYDVRIGPERLATSTRSVGIRSTGAILTAP